MAAKTCKIIEQKRKKLDLRQRTKIIVEPVNTDKLSLEEKVKRVKELNKKMKAQRARRAEEIKASKKVFSIFKVFGF